jgi:cytochrome d ubiquinol oxidase subunit II
VGRCAAPYVLPPTLTLSAGAASTGTQVALIASIGVGAVVLFPSLAILFRLTLTGRLDPTVAHDNTSAVGPEPLRPRRSAAAALALVLTGIVLLTVAEPAAAHAVGVVALIAAGIAAFAAVAPDELAKQPASARSGRTEREAAS